MQQGFQNIAQRMANAEKDFADIILSRIDCGDYVARKIVAYYLKNKLAKLDAVNGRITVNHGALLERDILIRAARLAG